MSDLPSISTGPLRSVPFAHARCRGGARQSVIIRPSNRAGSGRSRGTAPNVLDLGNWPSHKSHQPGGTGAGKRACEAVRINKHAFSEALRTSSQARRKFLSLRCWLPVCRMRPVFRLVSTSFWPSSMVRVSGFSQ